MTEYHIEKAQELINEFLSINSGNEDSYQILNSTFYNTIGALSASENIVFRNFYAQYRYVTSILPLSIRTRENLEGIRLFLKKRSGLTKLSDEELKDSKHIFSLISQSFQSNSSVIHEYDTCFLQYISKVDQQNLKSISVLVESWSLLVDDYFYIEGYELNNFLGLLKIKIKSFEFTKFTYLHELLENGQIIHFDNLNSSENGKQHLVTTFQTLITIEPDFLIDATNISECFQYHGTNSQIFLLKQIVPNLAGSAALKGSIIGNLLDYLIIDSNERPGDIFKSSLIQNAFNAARFGSDEIDQIKQSIAIEHFPKIRRLAEAAASRNSWIEPTYFSTTYGLQGRIDLLIKNDESGSNNIVELKSGGVPKPTFLTAWPNHKYQVVCYDMMLESTYSTNRTGTNSIYYSKCQVSPFRNIVSEGKEKQEVLRVRNELSGYIFRLANNDFSSFINIAQNGIRFLPSFSVEELKRFQKLYNPSKINTSYYNELFAFVLRELINAKVGLEVPEDEKENQNGFAALWRDNLLSKEAAFRIIKNLKILQIDEATGSIKLEITDEEGHAFRKGDLILFYPKIDGAYIAIKQHILKGAIDEINSSFVVISLFNKQTNYSFLRQFDLWAIEPDLYERNYWSNIASFINILGSSDSFLQLILGRLEPLSDNKVFKLPQGLTERQNNCITDALNACNYYLLQGPPGTGKTSTFLVEYVKQQMVLPGKTIIILAFTNKAVDKICENLVSPRISNKTKIDFVRLGDKSSKHSHGIHELIIDLESVDDWNNAIKGKPILVSTVASFLNNFLLIKEYIPFDEVIIDEASQLSEASIAGILPLFKKFILIGDHLQLPAVITQNHSRCKVVDNRLKEYGFVDHKMSLFERLLVNAKSKGWTHSFGQLSDHYRMHTEIADLIKDEYDTQISPKFESQMVQMMPLKTNKIKVEWQQVLQNRVIFINRQKESEVMKKNTSEAKIVTQAVKTILESGRATIDEIGIISPFRAQTVLIKKELRKSGFEFEEELVDTVERFQGDERKIVIFSSTVDSFAKAKNIQSIIGNAGRNTDRKLLVTVSRAIEQFICIGNKDVLDKLEKYRLIIEQSAQFESSEVMC